METTWVRRGFALAVTGAIATFGGTAALAKKPSSQTLTVCKHGCRYSTIQAAVDASGKGATIDVKPGK